MALMVMVVVQDDEAALSLVEWIEAGGGEKEPDLSTMTVPVIYRAPTMFHRAFETHGKGKMGSTWTLGQKYGWWVCTTCKKPSELYWNQITQQSSWGKNIKSMFFTDEATS
jgi:hypothetical protein